MDRSIPDTPAPFGYKTCWFAVRSSDGEKVVAALGHEDAKPSSWADGIEAAYDGDLFVRLDACRRRRDFLGCR